MEIPEAIYRESSRLVMDHTVALIGLSQEDGQASVDLIGSGTLISAGGVFGVLTAAHVVKYRVYVQSERVGLTIAHKSHRFSIAKSQLSPVIVAYGGAGSFGPDLAAILILDSESVAEIRARKSFWDLDKHREQAFSESTDEGIDACVLTGAVGEWTKRVAPDNHFSHLTRYRAILGYGKIEGSGAADGYDYTDVSVDYNSDEGIPESFGGVSGGGLWRLRLHCEDNRITSACLPFLVGVPFQQSDLQEGRRIVTCHYVKSLYESARASLGNK